MNERKSEIITILFSGGADSIFLLHLALKMNKLIHCVLVDYGQKHIEELNFAKKYLTDLNLLNYEVIKISGYDIDSALTGSGEKGLYENVSEYNVPARNTILLSFAAGIAESIGSETIWHGADMSDCYGKFKDCYQDYFVKINELFKISFSYPIKVEAPLLGLTKERILELLKIYNVDMNKIYSGYGGI